MLIQHSPEFALLLRTMAVVENALLRANRPKLRMRLLRSVADDSPKHMEAREVIHLCNLDAADRVIEGDLSPPPSTAGAWGMRKSATWSCGI